ARQHLKIGAVERRGYLDVPAFLRIRILGRNTVDGIGQTEERRKALLLARQNVDISERGNGRSRLTNVHLVDAADLRKPPLAAGKHCLYGIGYRRGNLYLAACAVCWLKPIRPLYLGSALVDLRNPLRSGEARG